jgi:release factor glutamine methyltransferase
LEAAGEGWDLVVANPPYVESLDGLPPELRWEPEVALVGTGEHERLARATVAQFIAFEVGDGQAAEAGEILVAAGWRDVRITPDLTGAERVVEGAK